TAIQQIEGKTVAFDETAVSDLDILCYYAYSPLYIGTVTDRRNAFKDADYSCVAPKVTVQTFGTGSVTSSPPGITCGNGSDRCSATFPAGTPVKLTAA